MFSYELFADDGFVILKESGVTPFEDFQEFMPEFDSVVNKNNIRKIIIDCREFQGWGQKEPPQITFYIWLENRKIFDKIAVVFHEGVRQEIMYFVEIFENAQKEIRTFPPSQYEKAIKWLKG